MKNKTIISCECKDNKNIYLIENISMSLCKTCAKSKDNIIRYLKMKGEITNEIK
jgi:hypothetical protein